MSCFFLENLKFHFKKLIIYQNYVDVMKKGFFVKSLQGLLNKKKKNIFVHKKGENQVFLEIRLYSDYHCNHIKLINQIMTFQEINENGFLMTSKAAATCHFVFQQAISHK